MTFVHDDPEFVALLAEISAETGIAAALVEKDYWITHGLWALHETKLTIWFKGGTSLSKGFGIIERFSLPPGPRIGELRTAVEEAVEQGVLQPQLEAEVYLDWLAAHIDEL